MNHKACFAALRRFQFILPPLVDGLEPQLWHRKPASGNWSILEIICHLRDEEKEDFRTRLECTLESPPRTWPPIDPVQAAIDRNYNQQDPSVVLAEFLSERKKSLEWLSTLKNVDWNVHYQHPKLGRFHAGDILASWAAHDLLHVRQITKRLFESNADSSAPFETRYAGEWGNS